MKPIHWISCLGLLTMGCKQPTLPLISIGGTPPTQTHFTHAYLLMGQSNMARSDTAKALPDFQGVSGEAAGEQISYALNDPTALYIRCAVGGSPMNRWIPSGDLYQRCLASIPAKIPIKGVFFFQGESEAVNGPALEASNWAAMFMSMTNDLRAHFADVPVVFAQIGGFTATYGDIIKQQQNSISLNRVKMVYTGDLPIVDSVHFTHADYQVIGQRMASAFETI